MLLKKKTGLPWVKTASRFAENRKLNRFRRKTSSLAVGQMMVMMQMSRMCEFHIGTNIRGIS
jgi:hypothetical protein